ncbi:MAG: hypothetical protein ABI878_07870 [Acidobacteriota bacterium]
MKVSLLLKFSLIGLAVQILLIVLSTLIDIEYRKIFFGVYKPWLSVGEFFFPSGSGGHALPGGAILGWLLGVIVYSLVIGLVAYVATNARSRKAIDR